MKTALQLIKELAEHRNKEDKTAKNAKLKEQKETLKRQMDFWKPLSRIVWEASEKYSNYVTSVRFYEDTDPYFLFLTAKDWESIHFINYGEGVRLRWGDKTLGTSDKVEGLIPALIDKLADIIRVDPKNLL